MSGRTEPQACGRPYRIELASPEVGEVQFSQRFVIPGADTSARVEALRQWFVARAKEKIVPRVNSFAEYLGVTVSQVKIEDSRCRWGSCTTKDNVNTNWRAWLKEHGQLLEEPM